MSSPSDLRARARQLLSLSRVTPAGGLRRALCRCAFHLAQRAEQMERERRPLQGAGDPGALSGTMPGPGITVP
jgi:hypothetical protein